VMGGGAGSYLSAPRWGRTLARYFDDEGTEARLRGLDVAAGARPR
jgi:hypothetical protein